MYDVFLNSILYDLYDDIKNKLINYKNILNANLQALKKQKIKGKNTKEVIKLYEKELDEVCSILSYL